MQLQYPTLKKTLGLFWQEKSKESRTPRFIFPLPSCSQYRQHEMEDPNNQQLQNREAHHKENQRIKEKEGDLKKMSRMKGVYGLQSNIQQRIRRSMKIIPGLQEKIWRQHNIVHECKYNATIFNILWQETKCTQSYEGNVMSFTLERETSSMHHITWNTKQEKTVLFLTETEMASQSL